MSCKLVRSGDRNAALAVVWRPQTSGVAQQFRTGAELDVDLNREMEARAKAAYQQGFAAGQASGIQQASERIEPASGALSRLVAELASFRKKFRAEAEEDTVKLAIAIARRVLHRE